MKSAEPIAIFCVELHCWAVQGLIASNGDDFAYSLLLNAARFRRITQLKS
jgi:hypothetical protein